MAGLQKKEVQLSSNAKIWTNLLHLMSLIKAMYIIFILINDPPSLIEVPQALWTCAYLQKKSADMHDHSRAMLSSTILM